CVLANNHVLDWGNDGLSETLATLSDLGIRTAGAGRNLSDASAPAQLYFHEKGRGLIFSFAVPSSRVPRGWAAARESPGVNFLGDLSPATITRVRAQIERLRRPADVIVISIHWGPNWSYAIPDDQRRFAHALIDDIGASIIHGHSSHHAKGIEVYRNRL